MPSALQARNEVHLLAALKHPNIVGYFESFLDAHDGRLLIIMELCDVRALLLVCRCLRRL